MDDSVLFSLEGDSAGATASIDEITSGLEAMGEQISAVAGAAGDLDGLTESLAGVGESAGGLDAIFSGFAEALSALTEQAQAAADQLVALASSADTAGGSLDAVGTSATAASGEMDTLAASSDAAAASLAGVGDAGLRAAPGLKEPAGAADDLGGQFGRMTLPLLAAGAAVAAIGGISIHMAGDFQSSMTSLVTGAGESQQNIGKVSDAILAMAAQTGETTTQLAQGMYMVDSAGYHLANGGLTVLQDAAEGAKVGTSDLGTVADATTTILNDFGSKGVTAANAVNLMVATVASGKTHMSDLASALAQILPTASAANIGINDVMGAMATMTGEGVPAANAATYLRQTILALSAPSATAQKALEAVGLTTDQVATTMQRSLPAALEMITDAVAKKFPPGSAAYVAAIKDISGGAKTMQGMLDLTGAHLATFKGNVTGISSAVKQGGNSIVGWSNVQQDMNQKMAQAGAAAQVLMIHLGQQLAPAFTHVVSALTPLLTMLGTWVSGHGQQTAEIFGVLAAAIGGALVAGLVAATVSFVMMAPVALAIVAAVGALSAGALLLAQHWSQIVGFFQATTGPAIAVKSALLGIAAAVTAYAVSALVPAIPAILASVTAFGAQAVAAGAAAIATLAAAAPFILIGLAVAAVAAGLFLLVTHWSQVSAFFGHLGALIGSFFSGLGERVHAGVDAALAWVAHLGQQAQALVQAGFALVERIIQGALANIVGSFEWLFNHNYYFHDLVISIEREFTFLHDAATAIWNDITTVLTDAWSLIQTVAENEWEGIQRFILAPIEALVGLLDAQAARIRSVLSDAWGGISHDAEAAWSAFVGLIGGFAGRAGDATHSVADALTAPINNLAGTLFSAGQHLMQMLLQGITSMAGQVGNAAKGVAQHIASFLGFHSPTEEGPGATADQWMPALGDLLAESLRQQVGKVAAQANALAGAVAAALGGAGGGNLTGAGGLGAPAVGGLPIAAAAGGGLAPSLSASGAGGGGFGVGGGAQSALLAQILAVLQQSGRQGQLGAAPTPASLGSVTQNLGGVNISGVTDLNTLYQQLNTLAGQSIENGARGATAGLGL